MRCMLVAFVMLIAGCATSAPEVTPPQQCEGAATFAGTWRDHRMTQVGPARVTINFRCDCTFETTMQGMFMRVKTSGTFDGRSLQLNETTNWPMVLEGETLVIIEAGERHEFTRVAHGRCVTSSAHTSSSATSRR